MAPIYKNRFFKALSVLLLICFALSGCNPQDDDGLSSDDLPPNNETQVHDKFDGLYEMGQESIWVYIDYPSEKNENPYGEGLDVNFCFIMSSHYRFCDNCEKNYEIQILNFDTDGEHSLMVKNGSFSTDSYAAYEIDGVSIKCVSESFTVLSDWFIGQTDRVNKINFRVTVEQSCDHIDGPLRIGNGVSLYYKKDESYYDKYIKLFRSEEEADWQK